MPSITVVLAVIVGFGITALAIIAALFFANRRHKRLENRLLELSGRVSLSKAEVAEYYKLQEKLHGKPRGD